MRAALLLLVSIGALVGCQAPVQHSPYQYQFADSAQYTLYVQTEPADQSGLGLQVRQALQEKGFHVIEVSDLTQSGCQFCVRFDAQMGDWVGSRIAQATLRFSRVKNGVEQQVLQASVRATPGAFGAPVQEEMVLIRSLVDQVFPNPAPWKEE